MHEDLNDNADTNTIIIIQNEINVEIYLHSIYYLSESFQTCRSDILDWAWVL